MFIKDWKRTVCTVPNLLSIIRILLIPAYVLIYMNAHRNIHYIVAASLLALSCVTDLFDGCIARRYHLITNLGKVLDPIADKATQFSTILCLALKKHLPGFWIILGLFVLKEGFQTIAGMMMLQKHKMLDGALLSGKICTAVLFTSFTLMILFPNLSTIWINSIILLDVICMLLSFYAYISVYAGNTSFIKDISSTD